MSRQRLLFASFVLFAVAMPAAAQTVDGRTFVLVANGAGGGSACSDNLRVVAAQERYPLVVHEIRWCRYQQVGRDHKDQEAQYAAAAQMAECALQLRRQSPTCRIVIVGYSTGTHVALIAAGMLPPNTLDRLIVMASSVSSCYDLRPALRSSRGGIDSYFSNEDPVLANAEQTLGTADGQKGSMAGRAGFAYPCDPRECPEYANLRQYRWQPELGGQGGHATWVRPAFLRSSVVPVILSQP